MGTTELEGVTPGAGTFLEYTRLSGKIAREHGWWDEPADHEVGMKLALMHSEISEALECWRNGEMQLRLVDHKPDGFIVELADCIIRIMDWCDSTGQAEELEAAMLMKMAYNQTRPMRHGGKRA